MHVLYVCRRRRCYCCHPGGVGRPVDGIGWRGWLIGPMDRSMPRGLRVAAGRHDSKNRVSGPADPSIARMDLPLTNHRVHTPHLHGITTGSWTRR